MNKSLKRINKERTVKIIVLISFLIAGFSVIGINGKFETTASPTVNLPPTINITYPSENEMINGTITITGTANDSDGAVQIVEVKIDDGTWNPATGTNAWSYEWDTTTVANWRHTIYARAYDGEDYSQIAQVNVTVNNGVSNIEFILDGTIGNNGWYVSNVNVTINATGDIDYINYSIDGTWYKQNGSKVNFTLQDGMHEIICYSVYENGSIGKIEDIIVKVDTTPPSISYTLDPSFPDGNNGWYVSAVEVRLTADDGEGSGIDELLFKINNGGWEDYNGFFYLQTEGINDVHFKAMDMAGNEAEENVTLKIDKTPPSVSVEKPDGGFAKDYYEIKWNATDNVDENLDGNISIFYSPDNGTTWQEVADHLDNNGTFIWNTFLFTDSKEALIKVFAEDDAGNIGNATSPLFSLDNTPPTITINSPKGEAFGKNEYGKIILHVEWETYDAIDDSLEGNITVEYYDDGKWVKKILLVDNKNWTDNGIRDFDISKYDVEDGRYRLLIIAEDDAGNVASVYSQNFTIDTQPPYLSVIRPSIGYVYINLFGRDVLPPIPSVGIAYDVIIIGRITIEISATDAHSGIQRVLLKIDDKPPVPLGYPYQTEWDPTLGIHSLTVIAEDVAGNTKTVEIEKILCLNI